MSSPARPVREHLIGRFRSRHSEFSSVWTHQLESVRYTVVSLGAVQTWFAAGADLRPAHQYDSSSIHNMDGSEFAVGNSQSSKVLIKIRDKVSWKVVSGGQEWVVAIECTSSAGQALPPLVIFEANHLITAWVPAQAPPDWRFSTSESGWTSDSHAHGLLTTVSSYRPVHHKPARDDYLCHMTANVIAYCMEDEVDSLVLPPHCSDVLWPPDVSVLAPLR